MSPVGILDQYYLAITFLISLAIQGALFAISFGFQTDKLTDLGGSINFFVIAIFTLLVGNTFYARNIIASIFVMIWSFRLGGFLFYRVLKTGKDGRFDEMRSAVTKLGGFFMFQLFWCWTVSLPLTILNSPSVSDPARGGGNTGFGKASDVIGIILWVVGFTLEVLADQQKFNFKFNHPQKGAINDKGVWGWSRHPNYAGEIILWWGMYALCIAPAIHGGPAASSGGSKALKASVLGPIFISLLLYFVSGLPQSEKPTQKKYYLLANGPDADPANDNKWYEYKQYLNRTSILFPLPPKLYSPLPTFVKRWILLDIPKYRFDELTEGKEAVEEERKKRAERGD